jgi:hypothetical protein
MHRGGVLAERFGLLRWPWPPFHFGSIINDLGGYFTIIVIMSTSFAAEIGGRYHATMGNLHVLAVASFNHRIGRGAREMPRSPCQPSSTCPLTHVTKFYFIFGSARVGGLQNELLCAVSFCENGL